MPAKRKPNATKRREGTYRKDRAHAEREGTPGRPEPPSEFVFGSREEWDRLCAVLDDFGVLRLEHADALYRLVEAQGEALALAQQTKEGYTVNQTRRSKLETDVRFLLGEFGLTPASASKVAAEPAAAEENPFNAVKPRGKVVAIA